MKVRTICFALLTGLLTGWFTSHAQNNSWQKTFGLTHNPLKDSVWGQPVQHYISNKACSPLAIAFYYGNFRPSDNDSTAALLAMAYSTNSALRPFYRWVLYKTIQIQDGALGEYTGIPARKYAELFPEEFLEYMDFDKTGTKYKQWTGCIIYSGYYPGENTEQKSKAALLQNMKANCKNSNSAVIKRIEKFATDCFTLSPP
jgi:hypothetical protein